MLAILIFLVLFIAFAVISGDQVGFLRGGLFIRMRAHLGELGRLNHISRYSMVAASGLGIVQFLRPNDILFIDSSHVVRPSGHVTFEILEILPRVPTGIFVRRLA